MLLNDTVVPYKPALLFKYDRHTNVEVVSTLIQRDCVLSPVPCRRANHARSYTAASYATS